MIRRRLHLTAREVQVMRRLWEGWKHEMIARELGISTHTVDTHWRHIKAKLAAPSLVHAIHRVYEVLFDLRLKEIREAQESQHGGPQRATEGDKGKG